MDLSQQELPLTTYFTRGSKDARPRTSSYKKKKQEEKPAEDSQSGTRSSNVQANPLGRAASRPKSRATKLVQLPTPASSTRKRKRTGLSDTPAKSSTRTGKYSAPSQSEEDLSLLEFGPTPSKLSHTSRGAVSHMSNVPLATPSTDWRRTARAPGVRPRSDLRCSVHEEACTENTPLARSRRQLPSSPTRSGLPDSTSTTTRHIPVDLNCPNPFKKDSDMQFGGISPKQCVNHPKTVDSQIPDRRVVPMIPIQSSQSQYLLHIDATPKRKRISRRAETVISSQTQEERELTISTPHRLTTLGRSLVRMSPGKYTLGSALTPRPSCNKQKGQLNTLGSDDIGSIQSLSYQSRTPMAVKAMDGPSTKLSSPSRRELASRSPSCKVKTPRRPSRRNSIENIPPTYTDDSLTESESESDIFQTKQGKISMLGSPSREKNQDLGPLSPTSDTCSPLAGDNLAGVEDDSATEPESYADILHCVAEIGRKRPRPQVAREDTRPRPIISPLVSPARPRIAAKPTIESTQFCTQEASGMSIPEPCTLLSTKERPQIPSASLPPVVRDFMCMFSGDESYPTDFPESLRV